MYFRAHVIAATVLATACFVDPGATSVTTTSASSTTSATSTGVVDPTSSSGTTSTGDDPATTTTTETTDVVPPTDCWDQDLGTWPLMGTPLVLGEAVDPYLTADGLHLYYLNLPERRPFLSTRASLLDPFPVGEPIAKWSGLADDVVVGHPIVLLTDQLMLLSDSKDIWVSITSPQEQDKFTQPALLPGVVNTAENLESSVTASADAQVLIVTRNDGPPLEPLPSTVTFRQYIRTGDNIDPYVGGADVTPQNPPFDLSACPALSADGLRIFYTSTVGETFDPTDYATFAVYYTTRSTLDAPWDPVTRIPGLVGADGIPCVSSVTTDGCQLVYYTATLLGTEPSKFIAQRAIP